MPAEFFARTAISDEVAVLLFRYMSFLDEADKTTCRYLQEVKKLIENGKFHLHPKPYSFTEFLNEVENMMEPMCEHSSGRNTKDVPKWPGEQ